jgi:hypothetical protein
LNDLTIRGPAAGGEAAIAEPAGEAIGDHVVERQETDFAVTFALRDLLNLIDRHMTEMKSADAIAPSRRARQSPQVA